MFERRADGRNLVLEALRLQNDGRHQQAARAFQSAGNQLRPLEEKQALWKAAEQARRIAASD